MKIKHSLRGLPVITALLSTLAISVASTSALAAEYNAKLSLDVPEGNTKYVAAKKFADMVRERTDDNVDIKLFPNSVLGGESESAEGIRLGSVQMGIITSSVLTSWVPEVQVLDLPYLINSDEQAVAINEPLTDELAPKFEGEGFHLMGFSVNGIRQLMSSTPIHSVDDVKGKKMRVIQSPLHVAMWKAAGANPTPIPAPEIYNSMQTGVIDFFDNTATNYLTNRFYEVAPYYVKTGHVYAMGTWVVSQSWWQRLPEEYQQEITKAASEVQEQLPAMRQQDDKAALAKTVEDGATIIEIDDKGPWKEAMQPVREEYTKKIPNGKALVSLIENAD
ncbi:TRAP transporter substrate-binding protein [Chromohalobacter canadensis]|uniref:TRAP transporter substrate-binding protein n=1 Tax=Chromohalobacter canadensis TaxID=141389 RepID=UPI002410843A|nr:TRAP transporter substrate-binding protein [Chromohalobacter canadensis]